MDTTFYWPPVFNNVQLPGYQNLPVFLTLMLVLAGLGLCFYGHKRAAFFWSIGLGSVAALPIREMLMRVIPDEQYIFHFLCFYALYFLVILIFYLLLTPAVRRSKLTGSAAIFRDCLLGMFVFGWGIYRLWERPAAAILLAATAFFGGIIFQNFKLHRTRFYPTYVDLLERTGTRIRTDRKTALFYLMLFVVTLYVLWRLLFTMPFAGHSTIAMVLAILLLITEIASLGEFVYSCWIHEFPRSFPLPKIDDPEAFPEVDVFIATYNESKDLLYKTINGCKKMDYPDPKKVHIYLCDDGRRDKIRDLAEKMEIGYLTRTSNEGAKAGNLNNALGLTSSPLVVTFDADMIPRSNFLMNTVPYFIDSQRRNNILEKEGKPTMPLGLIQTPQAFYNPDVFQFFLHSESHLSNEQDYFYREIEPARTNFNSVIYGGSNTVLSRQALESVGGFFTRAITEDFATGLLIEGNGYVSLGISKPLAAGLSPEDFHSFIVQRRRWGRGVINVLYQINLFFTWRYSDSQKMSYWSSIQYWLSPFIRMVYFLVPILSGLFRLVVVSASLEESLIFWVPCIFIQYWVIRQRSGNMRRPFWTVIYDSILGPFLFWPFLAELFGLSLKTFKVTKKGEALEKHRQFHYIIPFAILFVLDVAAIISVSATILTYHTFGLFITLFWLVYNLFILGVCLLFVLSRRKDLADHMAREVLSVTGKSEGKTILGAAPYLDESQITVIFKEGEGIEKSEPVDLELDLDNRKTKIKVLFQNEDIRQGLEVVTFKILKAYNQDSFLDIVHNRNLIQSKPNRHSGLMQEWGRILKSHVSDIEKDWQRKKKKA